MAGRWHHHRWLKSDFVDTASWCFRASDAFTLVVTISLINQTQKPLIKEDLTYSRIEIF